ncbi:hypothetical protein ACFWMS_22155 [Peribacillus butanolivorans]|uniref:hypothetical protein n=1 Tax=Peribacillus butanolivorans TaxID=421767 RepID=UPI00365856FA
MSKNKGRQKNSNKAQLLNPITDSNPEIIKESDNNYGYLKDTAVTLTIITGLSYFLSLAYQKGEKTYYGIDEISSIDLNISSLTNSFFDITSLLFKILLAFVASKIALYLVRIIYNKFYKNYESDIVKASLVMSSNVIFFGFLICWLPFIVLGTGDSFSNIMGNYRMFFSIILGILLLSTFLCFIFTKSTDKILKPIVFFGEERLFQNAWRKFTLSTKTFILLSLIIVLSFSFYQYGYTQAQQKEEYAIFHYKNKEYVVLDKDKNQLIVAPIEESKGKTIIKKANIKTVELKSDEIVFFSFKNIKINKGLEIQPNERKEKLDKMNDILNSIR